MDHCRTSRHDNPHPHLIVRGRRSNGQDLVLPRDFVKHGLRSIARNLATEWQAREVKRNVLAFAPDWAARLKAIELHLDICKRLVAERTLQRRARGWSGR